MLSELAVRFVLGGVIVSLFAAIAECFEPKTFAGLFGAAPSVALVSLALAFHKQGGSYVSLEARSFVMGALGLLAYSAGCVAISKNARIPVWLGAFGALTIWTAAAFLLWRLGTMGGLL
jgi:hypothetical protein